MKITIESTERVVTFEMGDGSKRASVPARIWEGHTDDGIPVHCYITRICPSIPIPDLTAEVEAKFTKALLECVPPTAAVTSIPLRMIL